MTCIAEAAAMIAIVTGSNWGTQYARPICDAARMAAVDPIHLIAYVQHESNFRRDVVSRDGEDVGLGQIRLKFQPACAGKPRSSSECKAEYYRLLEPGYNLRVLAGKVRAAKKRVNYVADPRPERWLAALAGSENPNHKRVKEMMLLVVKIKAKTEAKGVP